MNAFLLLLPHVTDLHKFLCATPLLVDFVEDSLLITLQDAEPCFEGLEHSRVFIFNPLCDH